MLIAVSLFLDFFLTSNSVLLSAFYSKLNMLMVSNQILFNKTIKLNKQQNVNKNNYKFLLLSLNKFTRK